MESVCTFRDGSGFLLKDVALLEHLRTFALIVCAQRWCAGNATVIFHASLHVLVTIDWRDKHGVANAGGKKFTPLNHRWPLFFLMMNHLLYLLSTKYDKMIFFLNFLSSCHRIPVVVIIDWAYENGCRGWTLLWTTSLVAWNYLKTPLLKTYARKAPL